ncbi:hypothetical protein ROS62_22255 [Streptomyces sp. DSM 41972]|uniref:Thiaminase-2/PQQC domain-containing protein n=1 Tax=Streptomyces althioticus subsp. attaecolombicae TaxID=3075534 RepID=A0ABU3I3G6_9ACTN|nr:hypothetical protein [Streptomyces sp. DSM 41972]SCD88198.1 hypothetical protein GA0115238_130320 [Streptomyces sp. di50b]SCE43924.1 hypothetical protein GA0115245_137620 [Streptomyces sp. di188]
MAGLRLPTRPTPPGRPSTPPPADAVLAVTANFSAWGGYCATITAALRTRYGFDDEACAFFDFFAGPAGEPDRAAERAVRAAPDTGRLDESRARAYGHLLRSYEALFWLTLERPA